MTLPAVYGNFAVEFKVDVVLFSSSREACIQCMQHFLTLFHDVRVTIEMKELHNVLNFDKLPRIHHPPKTTGSIAIYNSHDSEIIRPYKYFRTTIIPEVSNIFWSFVSTVRLIADGINGELQRDSPTHFKTCTANKLLIQQTL